MTRINCIAPSLLVDSHLLAEYRELPRIFGLVQKAQLRGLRPEIASIPAHYLMGKGHVTFFYDKPEWLNLRFASLICELKARGFKPQYEGIAPVIVQSLDRHWFNDWTPRPIDMDVNLERITQRLSQMKEAQRVLSPYIFKNNL